MVGQWTILYSCANTPPKLLRKTVSTKNSWRRLWKVLAIHLLGLRPDTVRTVCWHWLDGPLTKCWNARFNFFEHCWECLHRSELLLLHHTGWHWHILTNYMTGKAWLLCGSPYLYKCQFSNATELIVKNKCF